MISISFLALSQKTNFQTKPDSPYSYHKASPDGIGKFYKGREIAHVMGSAGMEWLERKDRISGENTNLAINKIKLPANCTIADIGAGTGFYTFKLAHKYRAGKIYAVEIQDDMINYLKSKRASTKADNVEIIKGSEMSPNLPANSIDLAIMVDVYHELEFPQEMLQSIKKSLRAHGKILLIEFRGEDPEVQIKPLHKTTITQLNKEMNANGFKLNYDGEFLPIQHFLIYEN